MDARASSVPRPRRGPAERLAAWWITGPLGHFAGGFADWLQMLGRWLWARARGREPWES